MRKKKIKIISVFILLLLCTSLIMGGYLIIVKWNERSRAISLVDSIIEDTLKEGTNLYLDSDTNEYIFQSNSYNEPNNYIVFNNEEWRILRINADMSVTIIRSEGISLQYDTVGNRTTTNAGTYCISGGNFGCNAWSITEKFVNGNQNGSVTMDSSLFTYLEEYYQTMIDKDLVIDTTWYYGGVKYNSDNLSTIEDYSTVSKIGILNIKEYLEASINYGSTCKTGISETTECYNYLTEEMLLLNPLDSSTVNGYYVTNNGDIGITTSGNEKNIRMVVTLKSGIKVIGSGSKNDPYIIEVITE